MKRGKKLCAWLVALLLLAGCATVYNPVTGRDERTMYSVEREVAVGRQIDAQIRKEYEISEDRDLAGRVEALGREIARRTGRDELEFQFAVLETEQVNAFAVPGGFIYVTTGLMEMVENDDELACILGHEAGHIAARHGIKRSESGTLLTIPVVAISILAGGRAGQVADLAVTLGQLSYSRKDEFEADELGMLYASRAGYDPAGMVSFLGKLRELEEEKGHVIIAPLSTHPPTDQRIENARSWILHNRPADSPASVSGLVP